MGYLFSGNIEEFADLYFEGFFDQSQNKKILMDTIQLQSKNQVISSSYFGKIKPEVIWSLINFLQKFYGAFNISGP